jgi:arginase
MSDLTESIPDIATGTAVLLGVPLDENSSFMRGAALAPAHIRAALYSDASNLCAENGLDLGSRERWLDLGDLKVGSGSQALLEIEEAASRLARVGARSLFLGGDHSITYPLVRGVARHTQKLNILHLDAHSDVYDEFGGSRFSHACPFARIMEEGLVERLVQVGIRTLTPHQRSQVERFGVEVIEMSRWNPDIRLKFEGPVYLSLDLDVLDPAFAPGVSHPEAGGLSSREVINIICGFEGILAAADLVELNPLRDPSQITAAAAAKFTKELVARLLG